MFEEPPLVPDYHPEKNWDELLALARKGDAVALGNLVNSLQSYLWLMAKQNLPQNLQAKFSASDIVQQSFADAHEHFDEFVGESETEFRAWLKVIVTNNLRDNARRYLATEKRDIRREAISVSGNLINSNQQPSTPSRIIALDERDRALLRAVQQLPERRRLIVNLRHREQLEYAEIGKRLGISEMAARKLWSRSMEELRTTLSRSHDFE